MDKEFAELGINKKEIKKTIVKKEPKNLKTQQIMMKKIRKNQSKNDFFNL